MFPSSQPASHDLAGPALELAILKEAARVDVAWEQRGLVPIAWVRRALASRTTDAEFDHACFDLADAGLVTLGVLSDPLGWSAADRHGGVHHPVRGLLFWLWLYLKPLRS